jgi:hypothetical protein
MNENARLVLALGLEQCLGLGDIDVAGRRNRQGLVDIELVGMGYQRQTRLQLRQHLQVPGIVHRSNLALKVRSHWAHTTGFEVLERPFVVPVLNSHLHRTESGDGEQANRLLRERIVARYGAGAAVRLIVSGRAQPRGSLGAFPIGGAPWLCLRGVHEFSRT